MNIIHNVIDGQSVAGDTTNSTPVLNPSTGEVIGECAEASLDQAAAAVEAAGAAQRAWAAKTPGDRAETLRHLADRFEARLEEFIAAESADAGKPVTPTRNAEMPGILGSLRHFGSAARHASGQAGGEYVGGLSSYLRREPVGVVLGITPWNFPLWQAVWKLAPALAAGNAVIIKPAENTPISTTMFAEMATEVLGAGLLNVVHGRGSVIGDALVRKAGVDLITFTGSTRAGTQIAAAAAEGNKRTIMELGGNSPVIIFDDVDLEAAVPILVNGLLFNAGQECMSATRLIVHEKMLDRVTDELRTALETVVVGPADDAATVVGPLISEHQRDQVAAIVDARPAHSELVTGGVRLDRPGFFYAPTLISGLHQDDALIQDEIFGPVGTIQTFSDEDEAIALANGVGQGLASSVWTRDVGRSLRCVNALEAGMVWVNNHMEVGPDMPIGGFGASGYGKEGGAQGIEEFTRLKQVIISLS